MFEFTRNAITQKTETLNFIDLSRKMNVNNHKLLHTYMYMYMVYTFIVRGIHFEPFSTCNLYKTPAEM